MPNWYPNATNPPQITGQGGRWVTDGNGNAFWLPDTSNAGNYKGQGTPQVNGQGGHWQNSPDGTTAIWVPDAPPPGNTSPTANAPTTAPTPPPDWRTQQGWWGSLYPTEITQRTAYDLDPSFAWATMANKQGGNSWAPEYSWLGGQQSRMYGLYADENTRAQGTPEGQMTFADFVERNAPTFHREFMQQPASQRGVVDYWMPQGRSTF
jgi:hypothetical protein